MQRRLDAKSFDAGKGEWVLKQADAAELLTSNDSGRIEDLRDILECYYEIARTRFVDNVRMQVADTTLVTGPNSPLRLFSPRFAAGLTAEQLEEVAGEDPSVKTRRAALEKEIQRLEGAKKILR
jgi:hypothetical protein